MLTYRWHLEVTKLVPEILNSVQANHSRDKEADELDACNTTDAQTSHEQPEEPLGFEALILKTVEFGPAEHGRDGTTEEHRIEENKPCAY